MLFIRFHDYRQLSKIGDLIVVERKKTRRQIAPCLRRKHRKKYVESFPKKNQNQLIRYIFTQNNDLM